MAPPPRTSAALLAEGVGGGRGGGGGGGSSFSSSRDRRGGGAPGADSASSSSAVSEVGAPFHALPDSGEASGVGLANPRRSSSSGGGGSGVDEESAVRGGSGSGGDGGVGVGVGGGKPYSPLETSSAAVLGAASAPTPRRPRNDDMFFSWMSDGTRMTIIQSCYMSVFAILGALLRMAIAQLFGEECKNPGSVGWLAGDEPLCVTADGEASQEGGIVFADLPANLLGSFVMGMFQTGAALDLPVDMGVAWLGPDNAFQGWDVIHLAVRTGFCGSLTTFSSWNSEMVVMIYGTGNVGVKSQFVRAMFGYIIGVETAVGSFVFGKNMATWIFRAVNPDLAREENAAEKTRARGVWIDRTLPDFERRYLPDLDVERVSYYDSETVAHLERWRASTQDHRRVGDPLLPSLREIEREALVRGKRVPPELRAVADKAGWNADELEAWTEGKGRLGRESGAADSAASAAVAADDQTREDPAHVNLNVAVPLVSTFMILLLLGLVLHNGDDAPSITYRTMWYAGLCAPFGALLRWRLSAYNGTLPGMLSWFPAGTLAANLVASVISIAAIASELRLAGQYGGFWVEGTLRAIKVGFAGSLSTVSTFVAEIATHMKKPNQYRGYKYILVSLGLCCLFGVAIYGWIVYVI